MFRNEQVNNLQTTTTSRRTRCNERFITNSSASSYGAPLAVTLNIRVAYDSKLLQLFNVLSVSYKLT